MLKVPEPAQDNEEAGCCFMVWSLLCCLEENISIPQGLQSGRQGENEVDLPE